MNFADVGCRFFHHTDSLTLRRIRIKDLRVLCLGHAEIEIAVKLRHAAVIVGMHHFCIRRIGNCIACLHEMARIDHILIEQRALNKAAQFLIRFTVIHRADVGTEKCFDAEFRKIARILDIALFWIIKPSRKPLERTAVLARKLPCIRRFHMRQRKFFHQMFHALVIVRHGILGHKKQKVRIGTLRHCPSCSAVVELAWLDVLHHNLVRKLFPRRIPELFPRIDHPDRPDRVSLF